MCSSPPSSTRYRVTDLFSQDLFTPSQSNFFPSISEGLGRSVSLSTDGLMTVVLVLPRPPDQTRPTTYSSMMITLIYFTLVRTRFFFHFQRRCWIISFPADGVIIVLLASPVTQTPATYSPMILITKTYFIPLTTLFFLPLPKGIEE